MAKRRSKEELIKDYEEKIKRLKEEVSEVKVKEPKITKESPGVAEAVTAIDNAATQNKTSVGDIIKVISRIKRTGLKIENATRKAKE